MEYQTENMLNRNDISEYNGLKEALKGYNLEKDGFIYDSSDNWDNDSDSNHSEYQDADRNSKKNKNGIIQPGGGGIGTFVLWALFGR